MWSVMFIFKPATVITLKQYCWLLWMKYAVDGVPNITSLPFSPYNMTWNTHIRTHTHTHTHTHTYIYIHAYINTQIYTHTCERQTTEEQTIHVTIMNTHDYKHIRTHTRTHTNTYTHKHTHTSHTNTHTHLKGEVNHREFIKKSSHSRIWDTMTIEYVRTACDHWQIREFLLEQRLEVAVLIGSKYDGTCTAV